MSLSIIITATEVKSKKLIAKNKKIMYAILSQKLNFVKKYAFCKKMSWFSKKLFSTLKTIVKEKIADSNSEVLISLSKKTSI